MEQHTRLPTEHAHCCGVLQVGVVSDFDLLAMDVSRKTNSNLFPSTDDTWQVQAAGQSQLQGNCPRA